MYNNRYDNRTYEKFSNVIEYYAKKIYREITVPDTVLAYETKDHLRLPPDDGMCRPIVPGTKWGEEFGNVWLKFRYVVPEELDGREIYLIPNAEACEYLCFKNGKPNGIVNQKNDFIGGGHSAFLMTDHAKAGEVLDIAVEAYSGHACFGVSPYNEYGRDFVNDRGDFTRTYHGAKVCVAETEIRDFCFDLCTVFQLSHLNERDFVAMKAREALFDCFPYFLQDIQNHTYEEIIDSCRKVREILAPVLEKKGGDLTRGYVGVVGHSHMDTAWLWPVSETIRKCARTYSKALAVMDRYPDYNFIQSSALHTYWMEQYYPDIFEGIRKRVADGRYEPNGGVWVECDCNITGGEAMIRQFLYGQRYTREKFGYLSNTFWLPDTFGYSAAIPQIMLGCRIPYFCTTKITWNDCNEFPEDTFVWRGLDGSEVLTHFNKINDIPDVVHVDNVIHEIPNKRVNDSRLLAFGYGDGGGGPTFGMMEYLKRTRDLPGMPVVEPTTVGRFMDRLNERRDRYPLYDGELYLEFHRGTLTSMHMVKQLNREAEIALHNLEVMNVLSGKSNDTRHEELYKTLLKNQFHDILPGTCIDEVYDKEIPEMKELITNVKMLTEQYADTMTEADDGTVSLYNTLSVPTNTVISIDGAVGAEGRDAQVYTDVDGKEHTAIAVSIPAMGTKELTLADSVETKSAFTFDGKTLVTPYYTAEINENGYLTSLIDRETNRQIANGKGEALGTLWFGEDMPTTFDNWEIEDDIFRKLFPVSAAKKPVIVSDGAVEFRFRTEYQLADSYAWVDTVFYSGSRLIGYEMKVDWKSKHHLLKAGFDVNVRSAFVKNEIQFGHIDRPTTRNNTLEKAKFEVCNHKWSDISETNYGVALLNNCKYGISVEGSDMRLTLHKGGIRPAERSEFGVHYMKYALLPHIGGFTAESVVHPAYSFNYAPLAVKGKLFAPALFSIDRPNIICEAVKYAEDTDRAIVLRLYECERSTTECTLTLAGAKHVFAANMLEEYTEELPLSNGKVTLSFRPFEIKTIIIEK